jgi:hypothetical protein
MFSRALLTKLNYLEFRVLKGQSNEKVLSLQNFVATAVRRSSLWQNFANQRNPFYT